MTEESNKILVGKLKQKLNITWNDEKTDRKLSDIVSDAEAVMNHKLGAEIDYSAPESGIGERCLQITVFTHGMTVKMSLMRLTGK